MRLETIIWSKLFEVNFGKNFTKTIRLFAFSQINYHLFEFTTKFITWRGSVHPQRDTISPQCPSVENTRMDSNRPRKIFRKQADL